mgnify:FL=1|jgi:hypothetical protein
MFNLVGSFLNIIYIYGNNLKKHKKHVKNKSVIRNENQLRSQIERPNKEAITGAEEIHHKDSLHYLRGGLDQITCKIATKKKNIIGFSFKSLKKINDPIKQAKILGRMQQNMRLCEKFNTKTEILGDLSLDFRASFEKFLKNKK